MFGQTIRVRDVPQGWTTDRLQSFFLQKAGWKLHIPYIDKRSGTATATFKNKYTLQLPSGSRSFRIRVPGGNGQKQCITIDYDFYGVTTLYSPPIANDHRVDIVAISGLGGHAYGSFKERKGGHMWLRDTLPSDLIDKHGRPMVRVMTYGYESKVTSSTNTQTLDDLASAFYNRLLAFEDQSGMKPIIFIAHSLGGLIVKQALILLNRSKKPRNRMLLHAVHGIIFFGVPQRGMDVESLKNMARNGPNLPLLQSISRTSSYMEKKHSEFYIVKKVIKPTMFAFYETGLSPTAKQNKTGKWAMKGPPALLVTKSSATHRLPGDCTCPLNVSHSGLVKFAVGDENYKPVLSELKRMTEMAEKVTFWPRNQAFGRSQRRDYGEWGPDFEGYLTNSEEDEQGEEEARESGCFRCGYTNHGWRDCYASLPKVFRTRRRRWNKGVCQLCGNSNHAEDDCYFYDIF